MIIVTHSLNILLRSGILLVRTIIFCLTTENGFRVSTYITLNASFGVHLISGGNIYGRRRRRSTSVKLTPRLEFMGLVSEKAEPP